MTEPTLPGFTAEVSLFNANTRYYPSQYQGAWRSSAPDGGTIYPAFSACYYLTFLCVAAILEPIPGDELAVCGAAVAACGASA
jgi:hypothetical protein